MNEIELSVIIGTYNRANMLSRCLDSVLSQKDIKLEIIIIIDNCTDNTVDIVKSYQDKFGSNVIKYRINKRNMGIAYNSNLAFSISTGEYIALIGDDDCWTDKSKCIRQISELEKDSDLGFNTTFWREINSKNVICKSPSNPKNIVCRILKKNGIYCGSTFICSRKVWLSVDGFDVNMKRGTDSDLMRRIILCGYKPKILEFFSTDVFIDHNKRMTSVLTKQNIKVALDTEIKIVKKYLNYFLKCPFSFLFRLNRILKLVIKYFIKSFYE